MSFLKNLISDLVEKRLWPVAAGLLVALVAVPVVLGGGGGGGSAPATPPAPATGAMTGAPAAGGSSGEVTLATDAVAPKVHPGKLHDPFVQKHVAKATSDTGVSRAVAPTPSATPAPSGGGLSPAGGTKVTLSAPKVTPTPAPSTGTVTSPVAPAAPKPAAPTYHRWRVDLRFGRTGATHRLDDVTRLTPLPSADYPYVVFLGIVDGKTRKAVFLVSSSVTPGADSVCRPNSSDCETVVVPVGGKATLDRVNQYGTKSYELAVRSITRVRVGSAAKAKAARLRASKDGRKLLRTAVEAGHVSFTSLYKYDAGTGLLRKPSAAVVAKMRAAAANG